MSFIRSKDDIHVVAQYKRVMEYFSFVRGFAEEYQKDPAGTLAGIGVDLTPQDIGERIGVHDETPAAALYKYMYEAKLQMRDRVREESAPENSRFRKWRDRQVNRCAAEFPPAQSAGIIHESIVFEISSGCSVGCEFCGLCAGPLRKIFRATEENKTLWAGVVDAVTRHLGPEAVRHGICYFGTEPLDNPDYEYFMEDWRRRFGMYSQITTAVPVRNIERTRSLIAKLRPEEDTVFRFSVRSIEDFRVVMQEFTPEELLLVELIPQFAEAPGNRFSKVGRSVTGEEYEGTISCLSGFLVNLCEQTISLQTPVNASAEFPTGQAEIAKEHFADAAEFEQKLLEMISRMKTILSPADALRFYPYLKYQFNEDNSCAISNAWGIGVKIENEALRPIMETACKMLMEGGHTRREIGDAMCAVDPQLDSVSVFSVLNKLWNGGVLWDEQLFGKYEKEK